MQYCLVLVSYQNISVFGRFSRHVTFGEYYKELPTSVILPQTKEPEEQCWILNYQNCYFCKISIFFFS